MRIPWLKLVKSLKPWRSSCSPGRDLDKAVWSEARMPGRRREQSRRGMADLILELAKWMLTGQRPLQDRWADSSRLRQWVSMGQVVAPMCHRATHGNPVTWYPPSHALKRPRYPPASTPRSIIGSPAAQQQVTTMPWCRKEMYTWQKWVKEQINNRCLGTSQPKSGTSQCPRFWARCTGSEGLLLGEYYQEKGAWRVVYTAKEWKKKTMNYCMQSIPYCMSASHGGKT